MRIRKLQLRVSTEAGLHGADLEFGDGLTVLWADNSMGKSTCVRSIMYALGFDAMLTHSHTEVPLPPAMKRELESSESVISVIESDVFLEIENAKGHRVAIRRTVKGGRDTHLVTVWEGPALSEPKRSFPSSDYYVARQYAAVRERGFHQFLATFLGWNLPEVATFDGKRVPLYLECIFPFAIVEQMRGWSTLQPPTPTQFRIREVHKRVLEFLLDLDAFRISSKRLELAEESNRIIKRWEMVTEECNVVAGNVYGVARSVPPGPITTWPPQIAPQIAVSQSDGWIALEEAASEIASTLEKLLNEEIPRVEEIASSASSSLSEAEGTLRARETLLARLLSTLEMERAEIEAVTERLEALEEDLQRNKDVQTLQKLGSKITASVSDGTCPTCHQAIQDTLTPLASGQVMSIDENIRFIEDQRRTFQAVLANAKRVANARELQVLGIRSEANNLRGRIRALRQTLVADGRIPSIAAIERRLRLEKTFESMGDALKKFRGAMLEFEQLSVQWFNVRRQIESLPKGDTSDADRSKLALFQKIFVDQLSAYGFRSVQTSSVILSPDTYRPEHDGFDLQASISASDLIRSIWAYLHGLLEVARGTATNHPGMLIFDEPKQQSAKDVSFAELLRRASTSSVHNQQVIFATSEKRETLKQLLADVPHRLIEFPSRVLTPM